MSACGTYVVGLAYSSTKQTSMDYDTLNTAVGAGKYNKFYTCECLPPSIITTGKSGILLNGRRYATVLYSHRRYRIVISSNEITTAVLETFIKDFWEASYKYMALPSGSNWGNYEEVVTEQGASPLEYIDGLESLPEAVLELYISGKES